MAGELAGERVWHVKGPRLAQLASTASSGVSAVVSPGDGASRATSRPHVAPFSGQSQRLRGHLTGPGALIALALIYIRSNNVEIARRMAVPDTTHALDSIRPDMLLYRALAVCLVMWDGVEPSEKWIEFVVEGMPVQVIQ